MTRKKALITGATGFIGSHLARRLVAESWEVHIIVRPASDLSCLKGISDSVAVHRHDGSTECAIDIIKHSKPDLVFHLASLFLAKHEPKDIEPLIKSNILFATQLVEAMTANNVNMLINTGTSWQHYENRDYSPVCLYAATKQAFEAILQYYVETTPLQTITLKLFDTYGPDDPRPKLLTTLKKASCESKPLDMSPGEQLIDLVFIEDIICAYMIAAERLIAKKVHGHEKYAVSSGKPIKLRELVEIYESVTGKKLSIRWGGRPYRNREVMITWDTYNVLAGWRPRVSLEEGIRRLEAC